MFSSCIISNLKTYNGLVGCFKFYSMLTFVGYLTPNLFFLQIVGSISNNSV